MEYKPLPEKPLLTPKKERDNKPQFVGEQVIPSDTTEAEKPPEWFKRIVNEIADAWFDPNTLESRELYEKLGVKTFKKYLPTSGDFIYQLVWKRLGHHDLVNKNLWSLKNAEFYTRIIETTHSVCFLLMTFAIGGSLANNDIPHATLGVALNIVMNMYPIMLQRYNRIRLYRILNKMRNAKL